MTSSKPIPKVVKEVEPQIKLSEFYGFIKKHVSSKKQKELRKKFDGEINRDSQVFVSKETDSHFYIVIDRHHIVEGGFSGGAVEYIIDKTTGEETMGWHESPMPISDAEILKKD